MPGWWTLLDSSNSQPERILLTDVRQLFVLKPSPGRAALVGGGVGFLTGVVLGTWFSITAAARWASRSGLLAQVRVQRIPEAKDVGLEPLDLRQ